MRFTHILTIQFAAAGADAAKKLADYLNDCPPSLAQIIANSAPGEIMVFSAVNNVDIEPRELLLEEKCLIAEAFGEDSVDI